VIDKKKGFTLIEVLVVIVIIVILTVVSISYFLGFLTISKEAKVKKTHEDVCKFVENEVVKCNRLKNKSILGASVTCPNNDADAYVKQNGELEKILVKMIINPYTNTSGFGAFWTSTNRLTGNGIDQGVTFVNPTHVGTNIGYEAIQITTCYKSGGCKYAQRLENSPINFAGANTTSEAGMCLIKLN